MNPTTYSYFDEAYFQDGAKRGTAYVNYKEGAHDSHTFREIAHAVAEVFQPRRVLDIGCATGAVVRWLNELGCEAHGIDVSEWAVRNAEHRNVRLSPADRLQFPDGYFDLVISCHSIEHLPSPVFAGSLAEITRVSSRFQFHMLPMVGTPPYDGDESVVRQQLRKDPTHQQLHSRGQWIDAFTALGNVPLETCVLFKEDTPSAELSIGQFLLKRSTAVDEGPILLRSRLRNQRIFRELQLHRLKESAGFGLPNEGRLVFRDSTWKDVERKFVTPEVFDLTNKEFRLVVIVRGNSCSLRFAAGLDTPGQPYAHVGEFRITATPGCNVFVFSASQLRTLRGSPDYSRVNHLALGGENSDAEIVFYMADHEGSPLLG